MRSWPGLLVGWLLTACAATPEREAPSSLGCARSAIERRLPPEPDDKLMHCVAGALIAIYCSPTEARLAGVAKELSDAFTAGDLELADIRATLAGVSCAAADATDIGAIETCCNGRLAQAPDAAAR